MNRISLLSLALTAAATLASCDYNNTPGKDPQASQDFTDAPPARTIETNQDSINGEPQASTPIGTGSAADQKTSVDAALKGSPNDTASPVSRMPQESPQLRGSAREE